MNLKVTSPGTLGASALPYGGRYPCANFVCDGIWYYGTYGVDFDFSKPESTTNVRLAEMAVFKKVTYDENKNYSVVFPTLRDGCTPQCATDFRKK